MYLFCFVLFILVFLEEPCTAKSRQKRCIVIQKQSGTHGDSTESDGGDEDYRKPQPKDPRPSEDIRTREYESLQPELLRYKILPMKRAAGDGLSRFRKRFYKKYL